MSIKRAYRTLYLSGMPLADARAEIAKAAEQSDELRILHEFIDRSERSLIR
jgi:UDP-N-acetylglucosamine acyltransferase